MSRPFPELWEAFLFYKEFPYGTFFDECQNANLIATLKNLKGIKTNIDAEMLFHGSNRYNKPSKQETVSKGLKAALAPLRKPPK